MALTEAPSYSETLERTKISSRSPPSVNTLIGVRKRFAFTCFGHYWPPSEDTTNNIKELLYLCFCWNKRCHYGIMKGLNSCINCEEIVNTVKIICLHQEKYKVTKNTNECLQYILPSIEQEFLSYFKWFNQLLLIHVNYSAYKFKDPDDGGRMFLRNVRIYLQDQGS